MFKTIGNFFSKLFNSSPVKAFEEFLKDLFTAEVKNLQAQLITLALNEVQVLMTNSTLSGPDKAQIARANIVNAAKSAGIVAGASSINLALEMAVARLKNANEGITVNGQPAPVNNGG